MFSRLSSAAVRKAAMSSSTRRSASPSARRVLPPVTRHTRARSRLSNSSRPLTVSITSGPDSERRPSSLMITTWQSRVTMPIPPKAPQLPPSSAMTGTWQRRTSSNARATSEMARMPAFASCSLTPPESINSSTAAGRSRAAAFSSPTSFAPWTSPTAPPLKRPSCAAIRTVCPASRPAPVTTPSSSACGRSSTARCGLISRSEGGHTSRKLPGSSRLSTRSRALASRKLRRVLTAPPADVVRTSSQRPARGAAPPRPVSPRHRSA